MSRIAPAILAFCALCLAVPCPAQPVTGDEPIVGGPCEGCELVFEGIPDTLYSQARIAPANEPGEPLRIEGRVLGPDGAPAPGTVIYAYHTDDDGIYPERGVWSERAERRHGSLRAWVRADEEGRYRFLTVRPASYPNSSNPQHVHLHVIETDRCTYWIDSIVFDDDPLLAPQSQQQRESGRGGNGVVSPERDGKGTWVVERNVILGQEIPNYPARANGPELDVHAWAQEEMSRIEGTWIASNEEYRSDSEPFEAYGLEWAPSADGQSLRGRLYGLRDGVEEATFWEYRLFFHPGENHLWLMQWGAGGVYGEGAVKRTGPRSTELEQVFHRPDGSSWRGRHLETLEGDHRTTTSFRQDNEGQWALQRTYVWERRRESGS